jgi:hypothetical protein
MIPKVIYDKKQKSTYIGLIINPGNLNKNNDKCSILNLLINTVINKKTLFLTALLSLLGFLFYILSNIQLITTQLVEIAAKPNKNLLIIAFLFQIFVSRLIFE